MKLAFKPINVRFAFPAQLIRALCMFLWLATAGFAVWVLIQLFAPPPRVAPAMPSQTSTQFQIDQAPEARLLGVETTGGLTPPSVNLLGIIANQTGKGAAVMSIEGQPPQFKRVGDEVANGWVLDEVNSIFVVLRRSGQRHQIDLPTPKTDPNLLYKIPAHTEN